MADKLLLAHSYLTPTSMKSPGPNVDGSSVKIMIETKYGGKDKNVCVIRLKFSAPPMW